MPVSASDKHLNYNLPELVFHNQIMPGDIGTIIKMHGLYYAQNFGFDYTFEAYVAEPLGEFAKRTSQRERIWIAKYQGKVIGVIAIVQASEAAAQLRWFLVDQAFQGKGIGSKLISEAIEFSKLRQYRSIFLWTVELLQNAGGIYEKLGFKLTESNSQELWGRELIEQRYQLDF